MLLLASWLSSAFAAGGAYLQVGAGAGWSDASGPLVRGLSGQLELGGYAGPYRASMRYGQYTRIGLRLHWQAHEPALGQTQTVGLLLGPSIGRGADLMNVGVWWAAALGPVISGLESDDESFRLGFGGRGEVGALYNVGSSLGIGLRFQLGLDNINTLAEESRTTLSFGLGLTVLLRAPVVRPRKEG